MNFNQVLQIVQETAPFDKVIIEEGANEDYKRIKLPYELNALEPSIDKDTMDKHYNKHYKKYVDTLNESTRTRIPLQHLVQNIKGKNDKVRFNAGGAYNHKLFWQMMTPEKTSPKGAFKEMFDKKYKDMGNFKEQFLKNATSIMGSGWCWLVLKGGKLDIVTTANQDNPLMDNLGTPLLGIDMWEHAFYLKHGPDKQSYGNDFFKVINWDYANNLAIV